jgi:hypothetical protein
MNQAAELSRQLEEIAEAIKILGPEANDLDWRIQREVRAGLRALKLAAGRLNTACERLADIENENA